MTCVPCVLMGRYIEVGDISDLAGDVRPISSEGYEQYVDQLIIWQFDRIRSEGYREWWSRTLHTGEVQEVILVHEDLSSQIVSGLNKAIETARAVLGDGVDEEADARVEAILRKKNAQRDLQPLD